MTSGAEYVRAADIARLMGISIRTARRWIADKDQASLFPRRLAAPTARRAAPTSPRSSASTIRLSVPFCGPANAFSSRRRMASERPTPSCSAIRSTSATMAGGRRTATTGSRPPGLGGRPRPRFFGLRFFWFTLIDFAIFLVYHNSEPMGSANFPPALTQAKR
jgi:hypothetical protein